MKVKLSILCLTLLALNALATSYATPKLSDLVKKADHIIIAKISKVDMIDGKGKEVKDPKARTGPGLENVIRYHLEVKTAKFIKNGNKQKPKEIIIELDNFQHLTLGGIKSLDEGKEFIFLLQGKKYKSVYPYFFKRDKDEKKKILEVQSKLKK